MRLRGMLAGVAITSMLAVGPVFAQSTDITIVLQTQPDQLDPCQASKSHVGKVIKQNIVETITELNPADATIQPRLAIAWEQIDELTWRFDLRQGVVFHDGTPFNAEAVKYSIDRTLDENLDCEIRTKYFPGTHLNVSVVGEYQIDIKTDVPQPILPKLMSTVVAMSTASPMGEYTREPIGTGPYRLAEWVPDQKVVLERAENYWGEEPLVTKATYIWRGESSVRAAMVALGEADIAPSIAVQDATDDKIDFSYLNSETIRFRIDLAIPPLDDVRVRRALNYATDRESLRGTIFSEKVIPSMQMVVPGTTGFNPNLTPFPYDPVEAKRLIDEARADGVPVDKEIIVYGRYNLFPNADESLLAHQAMWEAVGLNITVRMTEAKEWFDLFLKPYDENRGPSLIHGMHDNNNGDAVFTMFGKYHSDGPQSTISDPRVDDLIDRAAQVTGEERGKLYQEAFRIIHDELVNDVDLFHMVGFTRVSSRLEFTPSIATNSELQLSQIHFRP